MNEYMIGQRVIYNNIICVVCAPDKCDDIEKILLDNPERGFMHSVEKDEVKPLPNGQL